MAHRLALVGCRDATDGPWTIAKGNESKLEIFGLGQGESIRLEMETVKGPEILGYFSTGVHAWPNLKATRYRVCKAVVDAPVKTPTTVRIMLTNGARDATDTQSA